MFFMTLFLTLVFLCLGQPESLLAQSANVAVERLALATAEQHPQAGVTVCRLLPGEIEGVATDAVSIFGPAQHVEKAVNDAEVVWLFLAGEGTLRTKGKLYEIQGETIARSPPGWSCVVEAPPGKVLHALRVRKLLSEDDKLELRKYPENNAAPHVKHFSECPAYKEAIKSPKTTSRTLLPQNYVPRAAMGTVETTGPDAVGVHRHPMLEQLFLGLDGNDIFVLVDGSKVPLGAYTLLHIPLGSKHGAEVVAGKKLHYVWMDFFLEKEGQQYLDQVHEPIESQPGAASR